MLEELLRDYGDLWSDLEPTNRRDALKTIFESIARLTGTGLVVAAGCDAMRLVTPGSSEPFGMHLLRVVVSKAEQPQLFAVREKNAQGEVCLNAVGVTDQTPFLQPTHCAFGLRTLRLSWGFGGARMKKGWRYCPRMAWPAIEFAVPGAVALTAAHPYFSVEHLLGRGELPDIVRAFIQVSSFRQVNHATLRRPLPARQPRQP